MQQRTPCAMQMHSTNKSSRYQSPLHLLSLAEQLERKVLPPFPQCLSQPHWLSPAVDQRLVAA